MQYIIIPTLIILVILGFFALKVNKKSEEEKENYANDFINVLDIKDDIIYTKTHIISILKVHPISTDLLSEKEKKRLVKIMTSNFSAVNEKFKFLGVSRPIDIAPLLESLSEKMVYSNDIQRALLKSEIAQMTEYAISGSVVQRQFFILLSEENGINAIKNLKIKQEKFISNINSTSILKLEILTGKELIKFPNLIYNPAVVNLEDTDVEVAVPMILY